jgi:hypothetical protein
MSIWNSDAKSTMMVLTLQELGRRQELKRRTDKVNEGSIKVLELPVIDRFHLGTANPEPRQSSDVR